MYIHIHIHMYIHIHPFNRDHLQQDISSVGIEQNNVVLFKGLFAKQSSFIFYRALLQNKDFL